MPVETQTLLADLKAEREVIRKQECYLIRNPDISTLRKIATSGCQTDNFVPVNFANLASLKAALVILRVLSVATTVLNNMKAIEVQHGTNGMMDVEDHDEDESRKRGTSEVPEEGEVEGSGEGSSKRRRRAVEISREMVVDDNKRPQLQTTTIRPSALNAYDPTMYGPAERGGLLFPYQADLADVDYTLVPRFFAQHFLPLLGDTVEAQAAAYEAVCSSWGVLNKTNFGLQVAHLVKCMELCTMSLATLHPVVRNGQYMSSVLRGSSFGIICNGSPVQPLSPLALAAEIGDADVHNTNLAAILALADITPPSVPYTTMRALSNDLRRQPLSGGDRDRIIELASKLDFGERYYGHTEAYVKRVFDLLNSPQTPIPVTMPLHPSVILSTDRTELIMAAYGDKAPTFTFPGGELIRLGDGGATEKPNFVSRPVSLNQAINDLTVIAKNGSIYNCPRAASKKSGDRHYTKAEKESIWSGLRTWAKVTEVSDSRSRGLKQGAVVKGVLDDF